MIANDDEEMKKLGYVTGRALLESVGFTYLPSELHVIQWLQQCEEHISIHGHVNHVKTFGPWMYQT